MLHITTCDESPGLAFIKRDSRRKAYSKKEKCITVHKLGKLIAKEKIGSINGMELLYLPWAEYGIQDRFVGNWGSDFICIIKPGKEKTSNRVQNNFTVYYVHKTSYGLGLGIKTHKDITIALKEAHKAAIISSMRPINRGYWNSDKDGKTPHTVPCHLVGRYRALIMHLLPAKRGAGIASGILTRMLLCMAGFEDVEALSHGTTDSLGDFLAATFAAIAKSYDYCTPDIEDNHHQHSLGSNAINISANNCREIVAF